MRPLPPGMWRSCNRLDMVLTALWSLWLTRWGGSLDAHSILIQSFVRIAYVDGPAPAFLISE